MASKAWKAMKGVQAIFIAYVISLGAIGYAYNANTVAVKEADIRTAQFKAEADARAAAFEAQNNKNRLIFCRFFEPYAANPAIPATASAKDFKSGAIYAVGPDGFACTPDPTDGK